MPPPSPSPQADLRLEALPDPRDALAALYAKRLDFRRGEPVLPIGLMEGQHEATFTATGRLRMHLDGEVPKTVDAPGGSLWTVRVTEATPAKLRTHLQLGELAFQDKAGLQREREEWEGRGIPVRVHTLGTVYGIAGKVIDNRRYLLLAAEVLPPEQAQAKQAALFERYGVRTSLFEELLERARGVLELLDAERRVVAVAQDSVRVEALDGGLMQVRRVEFGVGYDFHGFEDRRFRGTLQLTVDRRAKLAVVNWVPLEDLMRGLVPAEIFARAHPEALKAQAVTARAEVLAKVGLKHLADPYLLCSEQHCAVYRGQVAEVESTNTAVSATRGEGLFDADGQLVDAVYSAVCGGHTEDNDAVWGGPPHPNLRGRPDLLPGHAPGPPPSQLDAFLATPTATACRLSSFAQQSKYRWERRFHEDELTAKLAHLKVGRITALEVNERGVSGRAKLLTVRGSAGQARVRGELNIRRLFGMLNSAMFSIAIERDADGKRTWRFTGGGWGHGAGMCQTGAIGRAEAGQDYREILRHYFSGAEVAPLY